MRKLKAHIAQLEVKIAGIKMEIEYCETHKFPLEAASKKEMLEFAENELIALKECLSSNQ